MIPLKELLKNYKITQKALPAFNIDSFEIYQSVELAVKATNLPCLVQLSPNEDSFIEAERLMLLVKKANLDGLPIYLNMDHAHDLSRLKKIVQLGFDMVHFDGSSLSYEENLSQSSQLIQELRIINPDIVIEVEFNKINLIDKGVDASSYTTVAQAKEFMSISNADLLAVSIGNLHGVNLSSPEKIDIDLLNNIVAVLPEKLFTLHGGSGISQDQILSAVNSGVVKINFNTDLRLQFLSVLRSEISIQSSEKIYDYLFKPINEVKQVIIDKLKLFSKTI